MSDLLSPWAQNSSTVFICFPPSQCLNPAPGSFGRSHANLFSFPDIILPSNWWTMSIPTQQSSLVSSCVSELAAGICVDVCQRGDGGVAAGWMPPPGEKMSGITAFSTQLTPKTDGAIANTAAQPQPKPWQQHTRGNRKPARPIREENALPSK